MILICGCASEILVAKVGGGNFEQEEIKEEQNRVEYDKSMDLFARLLFSLCRMKDQRRCLWDYLIEIIKAEGNAERNVNCIINQNVKCKYRIQYSMLIP